MCVCWGKSKFKTVGLEVGWVETRWRAPEIFVLSSLLLAHLVTVFGTCSSTSNRVLLVSALVCVVSRRPCVPNQSCSHRSADDHL